MCGAVEIAQVQKEGGKFRLPVDSLCKGSHPEELKRWACEPQLGCTAPSLLSVGVDVASLKWACCPKLALAIAH